MNINKKGYIYTLCTVILILVLIFFILFYSRFTETETSDITGKIRCDELHFFVEDVKVDLERGLSVTGRRATIYAISNQAVGKNKIDKNYKFNCTSLCSPLNCSNFSYPGKGVEAAIAELMFCGTLHGTTNQYMENHSIKKWIDKLEDRSKTAGFNVDLKPTNLKITPYDAWTFTSDMDLIVNISDSTGMCYFLSYSMSLNFTTSIEGLEDPMYFLNIL